MGVLFELLLPRVAIGSEAREFALVALLLGGHLLRERLLLRPALRLVLLCTQPTLEFSCSKSLSDMYMYSYCKLYNLQFKVNLESDF